MVPFELTVRYRGELRRLEAVELLRRSRIGESVGGQVAVGDPGDALGQLAVGLDELLYGFPSLREWDEEADWQWRVVRTADPLPQSAQVSFGAKVITP
jgi:hypothetical protein